MGRKEVVMSEPLPRTTLLQRGTRHLVTIFALMALLMISTSMVGYEMSLRSFAGIELEELLSMYKGRFRDRLLHLEQSSINFRSLVAYTNILTQPEKRWERLSSFLTLKGNNQYFSHIIITDRDGTPLFSHGEGTGQFPPSFQSTPAWHLETKTGTLYRVFRHQILLEKDNYGYLLTFHPITNSLLFSNTPPRTHLFMKSGERFVASSMGANGVDLGPAAVGKGRFVNGSIRLGSEPGSPELLVYRQFPELFSMGLLIASVGLCLLIMFALLWIGIGSWVMTFSRRVSALGSISQLYSGHTGLPVAEVNASTAICHQVPDEISEVATVLKEMTLMLAERDHELSKLALVASETSDMVVITDHEGFTEWVNEGFTRQTGYTLAEVIGRKPGHVLQGEKSDRSVAAFMGRRIIAKQPFHVRIVNYTKAGNPYWCEIKAQPVMNEQGDVLRYIAVQSDISARKRTQERMQLLSKVFYHSNEGMLITDRTTTIIAVNESFCRLTGYSRQEIIGQNPEVLRSGREDTAFFADMWNAVNLHGHWQGEVWGRRKDGSIYPKMLMVFSVKKAGGKIINYVQCFTDITEQKKSEEQIRHLAYHDTLTGLPNRLTVLDRLERAISFGRRNNSAVAVMFIDLDRFKEINDNLGHDIGDDLLIQVAGRLQKQVRESDTVARLGGDEFMIVLPDINNPSSATRVAEKILLAIGSPFTSGPHTLNTTPSIGIAIFPTDGDTSQAVIKNADAAMYRAKSLGRNNYQYFSKISEHDLA